MGFVSVHLSVLIVDALEGVVNCIVSFTHGTEFSLGVVGGVGDGFVSEIHRTELRLDILGCVVGSFVSGIHAIELGLDEPGIIVRSPFAIQSIKSSHSTIDFICHRFTFHIIQL